MPLPEPHLAEAPLPTYRPLATLSCHVTKDRHWHTGARRVDEVHTICLVALSVDIITVQGLRKAGLLQS